MLPPQGTASVWSTDVVLPEFSPADQLVGVDVAIVGGGITGLTTGVLLQRAGVRTAVLEQNRLGSGESGRTSAHLTEYPDAGYDRLATDFGVDGARAVAASKREAIRQIEGFAATIPCDFERVSGYLYTERPGDTTLLRTEQDASRAAGVAVHALERAPLPFATAGALEFSDQAQFHPRKYLAGLIDLYLAAGGRIYERTQVRGVDPCNGECRVRTPTWTAHVDRVIAVTHSPITAGPLLDTKLRANRSYVVDVRVPEALLPHGLFWDTDEPYHYLRSAQTADGPVVIIGGEDHRTGTDGQQHAVERLEAYARQHFGPELIVQRRWSGQIMEPVDGLPYIGPREPGSRVAIATGYAGNGLTFGTVAAQILSDLARGIDNPYADVYAPDRMLAARQWAKYAAQNLPAAWTLVSELIPYARAVGFDDLQPGEGRVVRINGKNVAASRDQAGTLHAVSPTCSHMGCDVAWNTLEHTWDCPCHGSRYAPDGQVLHGPATAPLESLVTLAASGLASKKRTPL